jgi:hypothetical protein
MLKVTTRTSKQDIVNYAEVELGVKLDESKSKDELVTEVRQIEAELGMDTEEPVRAPENGEVTAAPEQGKTPTKAIVLIHQPPAPDEESEPDTHCTLGLNGRFYQVQYGEEIEVPYGIYDILKNAKQTRYFQKKNGQTGQTETHSKVVQRYPFSLIRFVY